MKGAINILLLSVFLCYSFFPIGTFFNYVKDIKGYTERFCENKDKPTLNCNGKCHLVKELTRQEKQKENKDGQVIPEIHLYVEDIPVHLAITPTPLENVVHYFCYESPLSSGILNNLSPPPRQLI